MDVVLHSQYCGQKETSRAWVCDPIVFKSTLYDYEDLFSNDGGSGIAVLNEDHPDGPCEVQLDDHKMLLVHGSSVDASQEILDQYGIPFNTELRTVVDCVYMHASLNGKKIFNI